MKTLSLLVILLIFYQASRPMDLKAYDRNWNGKGISGKENKGQGRVSKPGHEKFYHWRIDHEDDKKSLR